MSPLAIPHLTVQGFPRDIGHAHGEAFRPLVRDNVETYFAIFAHYAGLSREQVLSRASLFMPVLEQFDADLFEEIQGIAEASGNQLEEIVAINSRTEIMFKEQTNASIVMNLTERTMWICEGNPCKGGYTAVPLVEE